jgi:hypothetical protein
MISGFRRSLKRVTEVRAELCRAADSNWQAYCGAWIRSAYSCSFVSSCAVIASLEPAPLLSSSLRVGSPRSLYFLRVPQEGFPATELASRRPGHCISTRTCIRGCGSSNTGLRPHWSSARSLAYKPLSLCVRNTRHVLSDKVRATRTYVPQKTEVYFSDKS